MRGQIYLVDLNPTVGREQAGRRPVLVVSANAINQQPLVVTVIAGIDAGHTLREYRTNIRVSPEESGLPKETVFLAFQLRSLDPSRFPSHVVGMLSPARMMLVDEALHLVLGLEDLS